MDYFVELARLSIDHYSRHHEPLAAIPEEIRHALAGLRAATFVSLHNHSGELRGCKGTLEPWCPTLVEEIVHNAISACSQDSRFAPVRAQELDELDIHVDVLSPMELIQDRTQLDVKRYGVLVSTPDGRRGVLLPDIETIDTVEEQISIACRKAGIDYRKEPFAMHRFSTTRHRAD